MVNLTIDGRALQAKKGSTILEAAQEHGIFIPTLCYHQALHPIGSCRVCVVEVKPGPPRPLPACATYVNEGMEVTTTSPKLEAIRNELLQLVLINHALECPICDKGGGAQQIGGRRRRRARRCRCERNAFDFGYLAFGHVALGG